MKTINLDNPNSMLDFPNSMPGQSLGVVTDMRRWGGEEEPETRPTEGLQRRRDPEALVALVALLQNFYATP